jgi:hypothetical protein
VSMKKHISNRNLAAYIAETMEGPARERIGGHIAGCGECCARLEKIKHAISPRYGSLRPGAAVRDRVMRTRDEMESGGMHQAGAGRIFRLKPRILVPAALGLAAAVALALVYFIAPPAPRPDTRPALVAEETGDGATIGEGPLLKGARVRESSVIVVPDNAAARLAYGEGFSLTLTGPSVMRIDRLSARDDAGGVRLECSLEQGLLVSRAEGGDVSYSYTTPGAGVQPRGTEFLLQSSGEDTLVLMKSGAVRVRSTRTGEMAEVHAGSRCEVMERIRVSKATADEIKIIGRPEAMRAGARGLRLLPVLPLPGKIVSERRGKDEQFLKKRHRVRRLAPGTREERRAERLEGRGGRDGHGENIRDGRPAGRLNAATVDARRNSNKDTRKVRREKKRSKRAVMR